MAGDEKGHQLVDQTFIRESTRLNCHRKDVSSRAFLFAIQL